MRSYGPRRMASGIFKDVSGFFNAFSATRATMAASGVSTPRKHARHRVNVAPAGASASNASARCERTRARRLRGVPPRRQRRQSASRASSQTCAAPKPPHCAPPPASPRTRRRLRGRRHRCTASRIPVADGDAGVAPSRAGRPEQNSVAWLRRRLRSPPTPNARRRRALVAEGLTRWGTSRRNRERPGAAGPAAADVQQQALAPPGLVICTRCTLGGAPFRVSGLCSISNPISRSDDDGDVSVSASALKNTRRIARRSPWACTPP